MGYRLHFEIPNVRHESLNNSGLELGKMYKNWEEFTLYYDELENDLGLTYDLRSDWDLAEFKDFVEELKEYNDYLIENDLAYVLYNMDLLDELVELAIEKRYIVRFIEY